MGDAAGDGDVAARNRHRFGIAAADAGGISTTRSIDGTAVDYDIAATGIRAAADAGGVITTCSCNGAATDSNGAEEISH